jgi:hypothetical protein
MNPINLALLLFLLTIRFCIGQNTETNKRGNFKIVKSDIDTINACQDSINTNFIVPEAKSKKYKNIDKYVHTKLTQINKNYIASTNCFENNYSWRTIEFIIDTSGNVSAVYVPECLYKYENDIQDIIEKTKWKAGTKDKKPVYTNMCVNLFLDF